MFRKFCSFSIIFLIIAVFLLCGCSQKQEPLVQELEPIDEELETSIEEQEPIEEVIEEPVDYEAAVIVSGTFGTDVGMGSLEKLFPDAKGDVSFSFEEAIDAFSKYDYERRGSYITLEDGAKVSIFNIAIEDGTNLEALAEPSVTERIIEKWSKGKIINYSLGHDGDFSVTETAGSGLKIYIEPIEDVALNGTTVMWRIVDLEE